MPARTVRTNSEVIPMAVLDQVNLKNGPVGTTMDDDFDRIRDSYLTDGITLDAMIASLEAIYASNE